MPQFLDIVDFAQIPSTNLVIENLTAAPASPVVGQTYYNTTDNHVYRWTGAAWIAIGATTSNGLVISSQNADGTFAVNLNASANGSGGSLVLWNAVGGLTANITGNLQGTAASATLLAGQTSAYYLDLANATGVLPVSAGGIGLSAAEGADGQIPIVSAGTFTLSVISAGPGITVTNGAGSITIAANITGAVAPINASYVVIGTDPTLTNERSLAVGANQLTLTDGGAGGSVTLGLSAVATAGTYPKVTIDQFGRVLSGTTLTSGDIPNLNKTKITDFVETDYVHTTGNETINGVKTFSNNVVVNGNLFVGGTTTFITAQNLAVADNLIEVAYGNTGPVPNGVGGLQVDRYGSQTSAYLFVFEEARGGFVVGLSGQTQLVATRENTPISGGIALWDSTAYQFRTVGDLTVGSILTSGSSLNGANLVAGSVANSALANSTITVAASTGLLVGGSPVPLGGTVTVSLAPTGTSGSYYKTTTDIYGRVIAGQSTLTSADIFGNIPWSKITATPTTLAGYGITDAVDLNSSQTINGQKNFGLAPTVSGSNIVYHSGNLTAATLKAITGVGMTVPSFLSVAPAFVGSTSGTFAISLTTQASGTVFAGPSTGAAAAPTFRALVSSDIAGLSINAGQITGTVPLSAGGTGVSAASTQALRQSLSLATVSAATISGNGVARLFNVAHSYSNADLLVQVKDIAGGGAYVVPNISANSSQVSVSFAAAVPNGKTYRVVISGVGA